MMTLYQSEVQMTAKNVISKIEDILVIGGIKKYSRSKKGTIFGVWIRGLKL
jgi:hypothetical protein